MDFGRCCLVNLHTWICFYFFFTIKTDEILYLIVFFGASKVENLKRLEHIENTSQLIKKSLNRWKSTLLPWKLVTTQFFNHNTRYFLIKVWRCWWSVEDVTNSQLFIQSKLLINHFRSMFYFYTPSKRQKIWGFLTFSRSIEIGHYPEIC